MTSVSMAGGQYLLLFQWARLVARGNWVGNNTALAFADALAFLFPVGRFGHCTCRWLVGNGNITVTVDTPQATGLVWELILLRDK